MSDASRAAADLSEQLDHACEQAVTDPSAPGVLVHRYGARFAVEVTNVVPYGNIHWHSVSGDTCQTCDSAEGES